MISVLCVTQRQAFAVPFLDAMAKLAADIGGEYVEVVDGWDVSSNGSIESVLDAAVAKCKGDYVLRLDDDEMTSPELTAWLKAGKFDQDLYAFPRLNLWQDDSHYIANPPLYPDVQTRFSTKAKAGGRGYVHAGSPFGTGKVIEAPILHYKFLVRTYQERRIIAERYESLRAGAGLSLTYLPFGLPEESFARLDIKSTKGESNERKGSTRKVSGRTV